MANPTVLEKKSKEVKVLSETNQEILNAIEKSNKKRRFWANIGYAALLLAIFLGIYYQFSLAAKNTRHIDCIIKLSETPLKPGDRAKYIDNLNNTCQIKFIK